MAQSQYLMHTVGIGDTIQSIALMYEVDWIDLVNLNGLQYPYVDDSLDDDNPYKFVDTVAKVGSKLLIPGLNADVPVKINNSSEEIEKYAFGCDLDLYSEVTSNNGVTNLEDAGYLTNENEDIKLSEGINNLRQQLITRLGTPKGTLLLHPEFGSNLLDFIGRKATEEMLIEVKLEVQECILGDFRVNGVSDIQAVFKDRSVRVECMVHPIEPYSDPFLLGHTYTVQ